MATLELAKSIGSRGMEIPSAQGLSWPKVTVFIFLCKFLLLAFKHGVQGRLMAIAWENAHIAQEIDLRICENRAVTDCSTPRVSS